MVITCCTFIKDVRVGWFCDFISKSILPLLQIYMVVKGCLVVFYCHVTVSHVLSCLVHLPLAFIFWPLKNHTNFIQELMMRWLIRLSINYKPSLFRCIWKIRNYLSKVILHTFGIYTTLKKPSSCNTRSPVKKGYFGESLPGPTFFLVDVKFEGFLWRSQGN